MIGFLVVLFELPCTGGPYFFALGLLANKVTVLGVIPYLLLYNVFFVLPFIILTLLLYFGLTSVEGEAQWKCQCTRLLYLAAGVVLTVLGLVTVLGLGLAPRKEKVPPTLLRSCQTRYDGK